ncbi:phage portal protein [Clostridium botulinum]|uniref:phage portal protein n=1 Tax=Clostridium botulinum TaxID=1491 RepID=UPI001414749E|nr:phage portal protein [Clostridium botulinum]MBN1058557.1 phage portal protein [Clostridium botulinum]NFL57799.1 phage portal protein [Clostridium botulinum]NFL61048.1 phage portal protein [Clostridium botulinum]
MELDIELVKKCYNEYLKLKEDTFDVIERYYFGDTDSLKNFKVLKGRSNLQPKLNLFQKLVDEEAEYSLGNEITIKSKTGNEEIIKVIKNGLKNLKSNHDLNLMIEYIKNYICFEINYIDKNGEYRSKIVSPLNGYMYFDEDDEPEIFLYIYRKKFSDDEIKDYIRVYTNDGIYETDNTFVKPTFKPHNFKRLPVGVNFEGGIDGRKTMFKLIKSVQDALETNFADAVCEISDTRNAIMKGKNLKLEEDEDGNKKPPIIRNGCFVNVEGEDGADVDISWMNKNLNDTYTATMLDKGLNYIYTLASHIDNNERMQSNLSGIALRSRLQCLEAKCKKNELGLKAIILHRIKCLFDYIFVLTGKEYDINDIELVFTPNIPQDLNNLADTLAKIPHEVMSNETKMSMFPNISNVILEKQRIEKENKEAEPQIDLNKIGDEHEQE